MDKATLLAARFATKPYDFEGKPFVGVHLMPTGQHIATVQPEWAQPFATVALTQQIIEQHVKDCDALCGVMETAGLVEFAHTLDSLVAGLRLAQRAALVGITAFQQPEG